MVGRFSEIEQTEGGFCCIVFHGVRGQREVLGIDSTVASTYLVVIVVVVGVGKIWESWLCEFDSFADEKKTNNYKHMITLAPFTPSPFYRGFHHLRDRHPN
jgi:hypothetical protein